MIFVDTGIFIGVASERDENHARAVSLIQQAKNSGETLVTTDHVLDETVTFLGSRFGKLTAVKAGRSILNYHKMRIEYGGKDRSESALKLLGKIDGLSFCDALNAVVMKELGIKRIYSFDEDFDYIPGIERIE